jgi:DNA-binding XRE family transcriptional regulator
MQVHVKTPHTKINIEGSVSAKLLRVLQEDFGKNVIIDDDDEYVLATETEWYKKTKASMTPKDYMQTYRMSRGWTQSKLGKLLGGLSRQNISDMENGRRSIGKEVAKKLAEIFDTSVEKFL